jgi:hypothetical protein
LKAVGKDYAARLDGREKHWHFACTRRSANLNRLKASRQLSRPEQRNGGIAYASQAAVPVRLQQQQHELGERNPALAGQLQAGVPDGVQLPLRRSDQPFPMLHGRVNELDDLHDYLLPVVSGPEGKNKHDDSARMTNAW